jgi:zinc/manganese transport system ATP-binding protein
VHHVSCRFEPGSLTAVIGPNGAGKSSLLDALTGRVQPTTGHVRLGGLARRGLAYMPQQSGIDRSFPLGVLDVVMLGAWPQLGWFRGASPAQRESALHALTSVGLAGFEHRLISELSVGQFQRVLFARVLMQDAAVILLDEPFNAIDTRTTADLMRLVQHWHAEGRTVIAVLHDLAQVREHFPHTLLLARECVAHGSTAEVLVPTHLQRAQQMAQDWDENADWCAVAPGARA